MDNSILEVIGSSPTFAATYRYDNSIRYPAGKTHFNDKSGHVTILISTTLFRKATILTRKLN